MSVYLRQMFTDTHLTAAGLLIFFAFFLTVCAWIFLRKDAKTHYEAMGNLPLSDGESHE